MSFLILSSLKVLISASLFTMHSLLTVFKTLKLYKWINFNSINYKGLPFTLAGTPSGYSYSYSDVNYLFVTVSNTYGVSKQYKVYRSKNQISATISVNII